MFGLGFTEILLIAIAALLFIGPDKLPETMKNIARTLGKIKRAFEDVKSSVENELRVDELRQEALQYRAEIEKAKKDLAAFKNIANKEANEIKELAKIEPGTFKPQDINNIDSLLDNEFEEAQNQFKELEKSEKNDKKEKNDKEKAEKKETKETVEFKNIKLVKED
jgi:sec-independent protein translocase protein TatB